MPIISHSSTWKNVAIYPLLPIIYIYINIYIYPIVTQDFTVHTFAREFIGTWRVPSHVEVCTVPKRSAISFATTWGLSWRRAVSGTNKKTNHRGHPEFLAFPTSNSLAYFPPKKKQINSNFTTGVMIIMKSGLWGILFSGTPLYSLKKYIYIYMSDDQNPRKGVLYKPMIGVCCCKFVVLFAWEAQESARAGARYINIVVLFCIGRYLQL